MGSQEPESRLKFRKAGMYRYKSVWLHTRYSTWYCSSNLEKNGIIKLENNEKKKVKIGVRNAVDEDGDESRGNEVKDKFVYRLLPTRSLISFQMISGIEFPNGDLFQLGIIVPKR